jgi:arylsulfatase A-like enzyme
MKPNVMLIVFDTARADAFEPYGAPAGSSTTVAQLARSGTAHQDTFSTACWTAPSHASLFSARLPRAAGFGHVGGQTQQGYKVAMEALGPDLLPKVMQAAGYATYGASSNLWISPYSGFDGGFDKFTYVTGGRTKGIARTDLKGRAKWLLESLRARADDGAEAVGAIVREWLAGRDRQPFFLFVNLVECHSPYMPPKPFNDLSPIARVQAGLEAQRHLTFGAIWKSDVGGYDIPEPAIRRMRKAYAASIRQLDDWLSRVLTTFDEWGILDDTEVIITSDHGENLGDGRLIGHAFSLDDRLIRVPMVFSGPLDMPTTDLLSIADVPRMLAKSLELDHPWAEGPSGAPPVAQFDAPAHRSHPRVDESIAQWGLGEEAAYRMCTSFTAATDGRLKLSRALGYEQLFDLATDPLETAPLAVDGQIEQRYGARLAPLRAALDRAAAEELPQPHGVQTPDLGAEDVAALEEQMRLLGYL